MKRGAGKHIKSRLRRLNEDLQALQKQLRHGSVYAKNRPQNSRHLKHPKRPEEYLI
ncbi:hypothetical protein KC874_01090 [Candidatus Saccharibacteria bacterium]|nr:hypothetical protein [Candidatus Saccharibacteria bacterium]